MKIGLFLVVYQDRPLLEVLERVRDLGIEAVEIGVANYPGSAHIDQLDSERAVFDFVERLNDFGLVISALSCHGNPLHPNPAVGDAHHAGWLKTLEWAEKLGVKTVNAFSGCPGTPGGGDYPNWVTAAWPNDYRELLDWQWEEKVIPYWQRAVADAANHGVTQIGLEMHPGFVVYNPYTLLKLRERVGPAIGANFDPSHLFWQGIDPVAAIRRIAQAGALFHVHAKDVYVDPLVRAVDGVLDTRPYEKTVERAWSFCTVGYGHDAVTWAQIVRELRQNGYDGALSIEHEDALASKDEGIEHGVRLLKEVVWREPSAEMWWA
jgi:sugar phosphate isomerase/epimerase